MKRLRKGPRAIFGGLTVLGVLVGVLLFVVLPALAAVGDLVPPASSPGGVTPTEINNGGQNNDCGFVGSSAPIAWRIVSPGTGGYDQTYNGKPVHLQLTLSTSGGNQYLMFTVTGAVARDVVIKGGMDSTWYKYAPGAVTTDGHLHAPPQSNKKLYTVSQTTFCLAQVGTIKGTVFQDSNESAALDPSFESGQNGWTVTLFSGTTQLATTTTGTDGSYKFENLPLGTNYTVCEAPPADPVTWGQTIPVGNTLCTGPEVAGQQVLLDSTEKIANFGNVPISTASCNTAAGYTTYGFERNCTGEPTKTFVVSTWTQGSQQVVNLHPTASPPASNKVPIVEKITWHFTGNGQNPITMVYDDTGPVYGDVTRVMKLCTSDPRNGEFTVPPGTTGVLPTDETSCMLASTDQAGGVYVAYVYTELDGWRGGN